MLPVFGLIVVLALVRSYRRHLCGTQDESPVAPDSDEGVAGRDVHHRAGPGEAARGAGVRRGPIAEHAHAAIARSATC